MLTNPQRAALLDELNTTRALWPSMPESETLIRAYAEHLVSYTPDEIHAGFRLARLKAEHTYPKIAHIVASCNAVLSRRTFAVERPEGDDRISPCCNAHITLFTLPMWQTPLTTGTVEGLTVDRYGIWHETTCYRVTGRAARPVEAV